MNFDWLAKNQYLASAAGGFVAALRFAPGSTLAAKATYGISGTFFAIFSGQALFWWIGVQHAGAVSGLSFLLGLLGMALTDAAIKGIAETKVGEMFNGALRRIFGLGSKGETQ